MFPLFDNLITRTFPAVCVTIIAINAVVFAMMLPLSPAASERIIVERGFLPARLGMMAERPTILIRAPDSAYLVSTRPPAVALSVLTAMFIHATWLHIIGNMWFLWVFGRAVEDHLGRMRFLVFYLLGGMAATFCHYLADPLSLTPVVGASGAIGAVLGGYAIAFPAARVRTLIMIVIFVTIVDLPALFVLGFWFLAQLIGALSQSPEVGGGVAFWAHVGGFVTGLLLMQLLWHDRPDAWHREPAIPPLRH